VLLLIGVLDEEKETLSGLAGPSNNGVGDLGLLTTEVLTQVVSVDRLLAEPEVFLREAEGAAPMVSQSLLVSGLIDSLLQTRRLVAESTAVDGLNNLLLLLLYRGDDLALSLGHLLGQWCLSNRHNIVAGKNWRRCKLDGASLGQVNGLGGVDGRHLQYVCLGVAELGICGEVAVVEKRVCLLQMFTEKEGPTLAKCSWRGTGSTL
jgi:hypothetical protein